MKTASRAGPHAWSLTQPNLQLYHTYDSQVQHSIVSYVVIAVDSLWLLMLLDRLDLRYTFPAIDFASGLLPAS